MDIHPGDAPYLSTVQPDRLQRRIATTVLALSLVFLLAAAPFSKVQLSEVWGFLPCYESALIVVTFTTAVLLYGQFLLLRSRSLLLLAGGYLFSTLMAAAHLLSFPRLFAPAGLLGGNPQTTAWIFFLWHGGFPLFVASYALLKYRRWDRLPPDRSPTPAGLLAAAVVGALACALVFLAQGHAFALPRIMSGDLDAPNKLLVTVVTLAASGFALGALGTRRPRTLLDLWLMLVVCAWICDIALAALFNHGRFDLGWYAGRVYGFLAKSFILVLLLLQENELYSVTARLRAEERERGIELLRASEGRLRRFYESRVLGVFSWSMEGAITDANTMFLDLLGYTQADLEAGRLDWVRMTPPESRAGDEASVRELKATGANKLPMEKEFFRKDGSRIPVLVASITLDEARSHGIGFVLDITERKQLEAKLKQEAQRKDQFLAILGHELRNPLAPIRNSLALLRRLLPPDENLQALRDMIERQVVHMTHLVDDLLDISRITSGKIALRKEILDLGRVVRQAVEDHRPSLEAAGLQVEFRLPRQVLRVLGDEARIRQVVGNFLVNSEKFTNRGGRVSVTLGSRDTGEAEVRVTDTGIGMEAGFLANLFEPFTQAAHARHRPHGGLGLGLALAKGLVELHGGRITAGSPGPGYGSTFAFLLPLTSGREPPKAAREALGTSAAPRRILIVEDNRDAALSLKLLMDYLGHQATIAHSGQEALAMARSDPPEVVLCDIGLPDMDGFAVAKALRADHGLPPLFLVAMTGYGQAEDKARALEAGFDRHLTKPADPEALVRLLNEARHEPVPTPGG